MAKILAEVKESRAVGDGLEQRLAAASGASSTPELRRPIILDELDKILQRTSQGGVGLGRRDRVVNLGRSKYVPAELIAQKIRKRFWYRM